MECKREMETSEDMTTCKTNSQLESIISSKIQTNLHKSEEQRRSKNIKCVLCESNHLANYKNMIYKDLQRNYFLVCTGKNNNT